MALLLLVEDRDPLRLRSIHVLGNLTPEQMKACERGESVRGVSPSVIQRVIESGRTELIEDPRLQADAARTPSLEGGGYSGDGEVHGSLLAGDRIAGGGMLALVLPSS